MEMESLERLLSEGVSIERIAKRFGKDPSTVSYWVKKHGLESPFRAKHAAKGGIERERLEVLVEARMTIAEIAEEVGLSKGAVRHWMKQYALTTRNSRGPRTRTARAARDAGKLTVVLTCYKHGDTEFLLEGRGYYRCKRCRSERVAQRRRDVKSTLVAEAGGQCVACGYSRCIAALQFHHVDPDQKRFSIAVRGVSRSLARAREEAQKCVLLCANCHAEVEAGLAIVPARVPRQRSPEKQVIPG